MTIALFIGRFQPLHKGHMHALQEADRKYTVIVGIGSSEQMNTRDNPLSFSERRKLVHNCVSVERVEPIPDQDDNERWLDRLDERFVFDRGISGNGLVQRLFRSRDWPIDDPDYLTPDVYSGTRIRERAAAGQDWEELVPACSRELLDRFNFKERVQRIFNGTASGE